MCEIKVIGCEPKRLRESESGFRDKEGQSNIAMVEAGLGISIMPQMRLRDCKAAVKVYPIEPEEYRVVGLAVQRPASMAPAVEQMFHHIVDYCRQLELPL